MVNIDVPEMNTPHMVLLDPKEIYAIGMITAQWAALEDTIASHAYHCHEVHAVPLPQNFGTMSFKSRRKAWCGMVRRAPFAPGKVDAILKLSEEMPPLATERHKATHGLADRTGDPADIRLTQSWSGKRNFHETLRVHDLCKLAEKISDLNYRLRKTVYPRGYS